MDESLKKNLKSENTWTRGLYMILFAVVYFVAETLVVVIAAFQFLMVLFTGGVNERLLHFSQSMSTFIYHVMRFFMFNSEEKPYPFASWPEGTPGRESELPVIKEVKAQRGRPKSGSTGGKTARPGKKPAAGGDKNPKTAEGE